mmetsp:Transcript_19182/g.54178  ORF Transcript_19182/g.54178 Transcript_19182/m.54178 type:complete len:231 (-) Transcript_19182:282-974(-)
MGALLHRVALSGHELPALRGDEGAEERAPLHGGGLRRDRAARGGREARDSARVGRDAKRPTPGALPHGAVHRRCPARRLLRALRPQRQARLHGIRDDGPQRPRAHQAVQLQGHPAGDRAQGGDPYAHRPRLPPQDLRHHPHRPETRERARGLPEGRAREQAGDTPRRQPRSGAAGSEARPRGAEAPPDEGGCQEDGEEAEGAQEEGEGRGGRPGGRRGRGGRGTPQGDRR